MRLAFVGATESSYHALEALLAAGGVPVRVFTLAERYARRHSDFTDIRPLAARFGIPITEVENINAPNVVSEMSALGLEYLMVIGWSQLLKPELLAVPSRGVIGFHPALLPKDRGRAALPWAILRGLAYTGATLFMIDEGTDSGDIVSQEVIALVKDETARSLYDKVITSLRRMVSETVPHLESGGLPRRPQDHSLATYTAKRTERDGLIDWTLPAQNIWTLIRAASEPYPGAFTYYHDHRLIIWKADLVEDSNYIGIPGQIVSCEKAGALIACGQGHIRVTLVQEEGCTPVLPVECLTRVHDILGIDWLRVYQQLIKR